MYIYIDIYILFFYFNAMDNGRHAAFDTAHKIFIFFILSLVAGMAQTKCVINFERNTVKKKPGGV